jgi:hypothetical protein
MPLRKRAIEDKNRDSNTGNHSLLSRLGRHIWPRRNSITPKTYTPQVTVPFDPQWLAYGDHPEQQDSQPSMNPQKGLCELCRNLDIYVLTENVKNLRLSAATGCASCKLLSTAIAVYIPEHNDSIEFTIYKGSAMLEVMVHSNVGSAIRIALYGRHTADDNFVPLEIEEINTIGDTGSAQAQKKVQGWLSTCKDNHKSCSPISKQKLPTRILDVEQFDQTLDIRLHQSEDCEEAIYLTLSHCWGKEHFISLKTSNFIEFQQRIQFTVLPRTFQDAVTFCRHLGVKYLWIDSLCIIQDSKEDWDTEASKMANVYGKSCLTIAAAKGAGPESGLFANSGSEYQLRVLGVLSHNQISPRQPVFSRRKIPHLDTQQGCTLLSRGWVLQERILSPRILYFGAQELVFECYEVRQCECGFINSTTLGQRTPPRKQVFAKLYKDSSPAKHRSHFWEELVSEYSRLNLTYPSDIFAALAGIAKMAQQTVRAPYIAGLWYNDTIADQLLWRTRPRFGNIVGQGEPGALQSRPKPQRAPTWSWASVCSSVEFERYYFLWSALKNLGCSDRLRNNFLGHLDFGDPESTRIFATASMRPVTLKSLNLSSEGRLQFREIELCIDGQELGFMKTSIDYDIWAEDGVPDGSELYCAEVGKSWTAEDMANDALPDNVVPLEERAMCHYLILRKIGDFDGYYGIDGCYERIGIAQIGPVSPETPPQGYVKFHQGFDRCSISIV